VSSTPPAARRPPSCLPSPCVRRPPPRLHPAAQQRAPSRVSTQLPTGWLQWPRPPAATAQRPRPRRARPRLRPQSRHLEPLARGGGGGGAPKGSRSTLLLRNSTLKAMKRHIQMATSDHFGIIPRASPNHHPPRGLPHTRGQEGNLRVWRRQTLEAADGGTGAPASENCPPVRDPVRESRSEIC